MFPGAPKCGRSNAWKAISRRRRAGTLDSAGMNLRSRSSPYRNSFFLRGKHDPFLKGTKNDGACCSEANTLPPAKTKGAWLVCTTHSKSTPLFRRSNIDNGGSDDSRCRPSTLPTPPRAPSCSFVSGCSVVESARSLQETRNAPYVSRRPRSSTQHREDNSWAALSETCADYNHDA